MAIINQTALDRVDRCWSRLATVEVAKELVSLPEAIDLDLFGNASLFQLMDTTSSPAGRKTLSHWLVEPATSQRDPAATDRGQGTGTQVGTSSAASAAGAPVYEGLRVIRIPFVTGWNQRPGCRAIDGSFGALVFRHCCL